MGNFTTKRLVDNRVIVTGQDSFGVDGTTTLDASQWDEIKAKQNYSTATADFEAAVDKFFAPLVEAAEKAQKKVEVPTDAIAYVTLEEATEGTPATPGQVVKLNHDSIVLRILESGDTDRLVWVDGGLEVLAAESIIDAGPHNGTVLESDVETEDTVLDSDGPAEG